MAEKFWSDASFEPKRKFKYTMSMSPMNGDGNGIKDFLIKKVDKPAWSSEVYSHKFMNHEFKYPGRVTWDDISVTIIDSDNPHTSAILYSILKNSGYPVPKNEGYSDAVSTAMLETEVKGTVVSKAAATQALGVVRIKQFSGQQAGITTTPSEIWTLHNAFVKDCKFGDLDYESEDMLEITMTLTYDWAVLGTTVVP
jgi:hypothetical protein